MGRVPVLGCIVEGHGEVAAVPVLIRRLAGLGGQAVTVLRGHRVPKASMLNSERELQRAVDLQSRRADAVVVLVDSDGDDVQELAARLQARGECRVVPHVAVAVKEYEAWFLAGVESLRPLDVVRDDAQYSGDPEAPRDAKGALRRLMNLPYSETVHQVLFSEAVDLRLAMGRSPSLVRLAAEVQSAITVAGT